MMRRCVLAAILLAIGLLGSTASSEPGNLVAAVATYQQPYVRGYTCGTWAIMTASERATYLLGIIALADALQASGHLDSTLSEAIRLPLSAAVYRSLVDTACLYAGPQAPVLAVLYTLK